MRRKELALAFGILLAASAIAWAQPPGCTWDGDPVLRYGWGSILTPPPGKYHQPGTDTVWAAPGAILQYRLAPYNVASSWIPYECYGPDTFCFELYGNAEGWTVTCNPSQGTQYILNPGYSWFQDVTITIPGCATPGTQNKLIAKVAYVNNDGHCDISCDDCNDPNTRPQDGKYYYNADTLLVIVSSPQLPAPSILQDTLTLVEAGKTQALIRFGLCNTDPCFPGDIGYHITSKGHVGPPISTSDTVLVTNGKCVDVYGVINAGAAVDCAFDTLRIIAWTAGGTALYDTCVQAIHVVAQRPVPLLTMPVAAILALALILAASVFMRRRA